MLYGKCKRKSHIQNLKYHLLMYLALILKLRMKVIPHARKGEPEPLIHEFKLYTDLSQLVHSEDTDASVSTEENPTKFEMKK